MRKFTAICLSLLLAVVMTGCGGTEGGGPSGILQGELSAVQDVNFGAKQTAGVDDVGHEISPVKQYNGNVVGIFYFLWLSQAANDNTITSYEAAGKAENTLTGQDIPYLPTFTWWGEPMYGFYKSDDEWVVRKHVELFINAGLDFICFDTTNNDHYAPAASAVLDVLREYKLAGFDVPKAMFMTNTDSTGMVDRIYNAFYRKSRYDDVWFTGGGDKPWILADYTDTYSQEIKDRFYFKKAQWPNRGLNENYFPWISWNYPQETYKDTSHGYTIMSVSTSQHSGLPGGVNFSLSGICSPANYPTTSESFKSAVSQEQATRNYNANWGRGYSHNDEKNDASRMEQNVNFDEQWDSVYKNNAVNLVFVTGWNEWIAQKQSKDPKLGASYGYFVDTYDEEFSRDVEMMAGGYADNCYLQMVSHVRKYKGSGYAGKTYQSKFSAKIDPYDLTNWGDVPAYADITGDTAPRSHAGAGSHFYRNDTGRNDISQIRVATTDDDVYVLVTTKDDITQKAADDTRWMNIWLGIEGAEGGYNGLQYVVNRALQGETASVDKIEDGKFVSHATATTTVYGCFMLVRVPKKALGISGDAFTLHFKVTDNLQKDFDTTDLYTNGDCAPLGRLHYNYSVR